MSALLFAGASVFFVIFAPAPVAGHGPAESSGLEARAANALSLLVETKGVPATWGATSGGADSLARLGLVGASDNGAIDPVKFGDLAHGSATTSSVNGAVDYPDAVKALGLTGYNFHLTAYPAFLPVPTGTYGLDDMRSFHPAYIGHYSGGVEQPPSVAESAGIAALPISFTNSLYNGVLPPTNRGDKFQDDSQFLRANLVPLLGSTLNASHNGSGSSPQYTWGRVNATTLVASAGLAPHGGSFALATGDGTTVATSKNANERNVIGIANLTGMTAPTLTFYEYVNGQGTELAPATYADYGVVEASVDGGATWKDLTPTADLGADHASVQSTSGLWRLRVIDFAHCLSCAGKPAVEIAVRWVSNGDSTLGKGWVIDDVTAADSITGLVAFSEGFEAPYYDALVVGSNVSQSAMTPDELKNAIAAYVSAGGKLYVLGGEQNVNWLQPLFSAGISGGASGAYAPDTTHPYLTVPNQLAYQSYGDNAKAWTFNSQAAENLFTGVVLAAPHQYVLAVSNPHAFGDGLVALTTWLPYTMTTSEMEKLFANSFVYGNYQYLYLEYGSAVPSHVTVASVDRTAIMDKTRDHSGIYTEMRFILYAWR